MLHGNLGITRFVKVTFNIVIKLFIKCYLAKQMSANKLYFINTWCIPTHMFCAVEMIDDSMLIMHIVLCQLGELSFFFQSTRSGLKSKKEGFFFLYAYKLSFHLIL